MDALPVPVVLDVDTGLDDACALLLAARHPGIELRAVTCVSGNVGVDQVVHNTLTVLAAAGRTDVPVARGATRPLLRPSPPRRRVHGEDGMGDLDHAALHLPAAAASADARPAVELMRDVVTSSDAPVTLVLLGPMTNAAQLLSEYPHAAKALRRIVFVGGAADGDAVPDPADFNVRRDPEAAALVLNAAGELGIPLTAYGLDVFDDVQVTRADAERLLAGAAAASRLAGALVTAQCDRFGDDRATIGDAGAICAVVDPDGLTTVPAGTDRLQRLQSVRRVDGDRWRALWLSVVASDPQRPWPK